MCREEPYIYIYTYIFKYIRIHNYIVHIFIVCLQVNKRTKHVANTISAYRSRIRRRQGGRWMRSNMHRFSAVFLSKLPTSRILFFLECQPQLVLLIFRLNQFPLPLQPAFLLPVARRGHRTAIIRLWQGRPSGLWCVQLWVLGDEASGCDPNPMGPPSGRVFSPNHCVMFWGITTLCHYEDD